MLSIIVIATTNNNKLKEFKEILKNLDLDLKSLLDFGPLPPAIEDGESFDDNAYKKAIHTAKVLGLPAIADDSGLVVPALNGEPGVFSARYAGENATDDENCEKLLNKIKDISDRRAYFQCVLSIAVPTGPALTYEGRCDGLIIDEKRGDNGFGYDPVFYIDSLSKTFAELEMEEKNKLSHRGKALSQVKDELPLIKKWLKQRLEESRPAHPDHSKFADNDWSS